MVKRGGKALDAFGEAALAVDVAWEIVHAMDPNSVALGILSDVQEWLREASEATRKGRKVPRFVRDADAKRLLAAAATLAEQGDSGSGGWGEALGTLAQWAREVRV